MSRSSTNSFSFNNKFKKIMSSQNFFSEITTKFAWVKMQCEELNVRIGQWLDRLQGMLEYQGIENPEFQGNGLGKIGTSGFVLGALFGSNISLFIISLFVVLFTDYSFWVACLMIWGLYATFLTGFHFLEFLITAIRQPGHVSYDSFIINHSKSYTFAAVLCSIEYWVECLIFGRWKFSATSIGLGLGFLIGGQVIRSLAMWTCGDSFSHVIKDQNSDGKKLVTHGIYSFLRHPSYFGWFYWSIGTQLLLCNPICCIFYTYASWKFFAQRIPYEEDLLVEFYGNEYLEYAHKTIIGIPFVTTTHSNDFFRCFGGAKSHST